MSKYFLLINQIFVRQEIILFLLFFYIFSFPTVVDQDPECQEVSHQGTFK